MRTRKLTFLALVVALTLALWGCGSNRDSDGDTTGQGTDLADANTLGLTNCFVCHNVPAEQWLPSRHANNLTAAEKDVLNIQDVNRGYPAHVDDPVPNNTSATCTPCHNPIGDGQLIDNATGDSVNQPERMLVGCESCHGGGQFHNGIAAGIPFATPGPDQCGQCHNVTDVTATVAAHNSSAVLNIVDTHDDLETTTDVVEGYNVKIGEQTGCLDCHYGGHAFDLTVNNQWAESAHAGRIRTVKEEAQLLGGTFADVRAAAVTSATGDAWVHYDWDAANRQSCQRCHTATGLMNFLNAQIDGVAYDAAANDFSHLTGWTPGGSSGENEMLYCWGCHSDTDANLRNPGEITLDFEYLVGPEQDPSGERVFVTLPDKGNSNVCAACHSGRGNDTSIRDSYLAGSLSSRFAGHHAPTAGSLYADVVHTGFEFVGQNYTVSILQHDNIRPTGDGPCVGCHMAEEANHTFEAVERDALGAISTINNQGLCNECHGVVFGPMSPASLQTSKTNFEDARAVLNEYVTNATPNYKGLDITANLSTDALTLEDYGVFQNNLYMSEEPCIYVHNRIYGQRLIFDGIDWLDNGVLNGTITIDPLVHPGAIAWLGGNPTTGAVIRP